MRILMLLVACIGFSCTDQDNPIALTSTPAGKAHVDDAGECLAISWPCDTEVDSVWTVFYGAAYRFQATATVSCFRIIWRVIRRDNTGHQKP